MCTRLFGTFSNIVAGTHRSPHLDLGLLCLILSTIWYHHEEKQHVLLAYTRFEAQEEMRQVVEERFRFQHVQVTCFILALKAQEEAIRLQRE